MHVKLRFRQLLFTNQLINSYFMYNFNIQKTKPIKIQTQTCDRHWNQTCYSLRETETEEEQGNSNI